MSQPPPTESLEIIVDQFTDELNRGDRPSIEDYLNRYPAMADALQDVLPSIFAIHAEPNAGRLSDSSSGLPLRPGRDFGEYRIIREVGFGGMGIVYEAVHQPLQRRVVLKVMSPRLSDESHRQRFAIEARAAAGLHHTHIVPVFETGEFHGLPYIALQYIEGVGLDQLTASKETQPIDPADRYSGASTTVNQAQEQPASTDAVSKEPSDKPHTIVRKTRPSEPTEHSSRYTFDSGKDGLIQRATLGQQIADAMAYAHDHGVLHRDIKPSNVLVDPQGSAWVTDFGLAKLDDEEFTRSGDLVGTLRYMASERFSGQCDQRSEVYSLGILMYELITQRSPFVDGDRAKTIQQITSGQWLPIRKATPDLPSDLETIIEKAIQRLPEDRYQSASELAEDLRRFCVGMPIIGDRLSRSQILVRWCQRNPAIAALGSALGLSLLLWAVLLVVQYRSAVRTNLQLTNQNAALEQSYKAERVAKLEAEQNLRANAGTVDFLMRLFRSPDPSRDGRSVTLANQLESALQQLRDDPEMPWENRAALLQAVGVSLRSLGLIQDSVEALQLSDQIQAERLAEDSARRLVTQAHLGSSLIAAGRLDDALQLLEPNWESSQSVFGEFDPQTRTVANLLADALRISNRASDAVRLLSPIREWEKEHAVQPSEQSAKTLNNLALALAATGQVAEAVDLMKLCLEQQTALHGQDDPRTLMACNNLANLYGRMGRIEDAQPLIERVYETRRRVLGPDHPETLNSQNGLAGIYMNTGQLPRALTVLEDVVGKLSGTLGESHPQTLMTSYNLGVLQMKTGDHQAAFTTFDNCVEKMGQLWNPQHPTVIKSRRYRARCQNELGNTDDAKQDLEALITELKSKEADDKTIESVQDELAALGKAIP